MLFDKERVLGLDIGDRTIGIAVSDELLWTAQGVETIRRTSLEQDLERLGELVRQYHVKTMVLGMPKHMNGDIGLRCELVQEFAEQIRDRFPEIKIVFWDERLSTAEANRYLLEADMRRRKRKKVIDKMAAVIILQGYLDSLSRQL